MAAWLSSLKAELRALLCGWLAIALVASGAFGAADHLTPAEALYHQIEQATCLQTGDTHQDQDQHKACDHDCCLPNLGAAPFVVASASGSDPFAVPVRTAALEPVIWATPAHHPHHTQLGIPRGPPSLLL